MKFSENAGEVLTTLLWWPVCIDPNAHSLLMVKLVSPLAAIAPFNCHLTSHTYMCDWSHENELMDAICVGRGIPQYPIPWGKEKARNEVSFWKAKSCGNVVVTCCIHRTLVLSLREFHSAFRSETQSGEEESKHSKVRGDKLDLPCTNNTYCSREGNTDSSECLPSPNESPPLCSYILCVCAIPACSVTVFIHTACLCYTCM